MTTPIAVDGLLETNNCMSVDFDDLDDTIIKALADDASNGTLPTPDVNSLDIKIPDEIPTATPNAESLQFSDSAEQPMDIVDDSKSIDNSSVVVNNSHSNQESVEENVSDAKFEERAFEVIATKQDPQDYVPMETNIGTNSLLPSATSKFPPLPILSNMDEDSDSVTDEVGQLPAEPVSISEVPKASHDGDFKDDSDDMLEASRHLFIVNYFIIFKQGCSKG